MSILIYRNIQKKQNKIANSLRFNLILRLNSFFVICKVDALYLYHIYIIYNE